MSASSYVSLTRQSGLMREMHVIANNIANVSTTGFRREGIVFSEYVKALEDTEGSLSLARAHARHTDLTQGALTQTGAAFDFAIEGEGFFQVETPDGPNLTRSGSFTPNQDGELVTVDGARLLDSGGAPIFAPPDARSVVLAADGTLSADGTPIAQIGLFLPENPTDLQNRAGSRFHVEGEIRPVENAVILQGFVENSNVDPISEIARMIEVQHAYQIGQQFLDKEDERIMSVLQALSR